VNKFTLQEFKNWLSDQKDISKFFNLSIETHDQYEECIGKHAKPRVCECKLLAKIKCDDDPQALVQEFIENGGEIVSMDNKEAYIEVNSGNFYLPRFCVKIKKS
jgi:hypothetical protein